jgi:hypothetical protein
VGIGGYRLEKNTRPLLSLHLLASSEENYKNLTQNSRSLTHDSSPELHSDRHCATALGVLITRSGTERRTIVRVRTLKAVKRIEREEGKNGKGCQRKKKGKKKEISQEGKKDIGRIREAMIAQSVKRLAAGWTPEGSALESR